MEKENSIRQGQPPQKAYGSTVTVVAAVLKHAGRVLLTRRYDDAHLGGLWEFPGGKVEKGESLEEALIREIREELGIRIKLGPLIRDETFAYDDRTVHLHFFDCRVLKGEPRAIGVAEMAWVFPAELDRYCLLKANAKLVAQLQEN